MSGTLVLLALAALAAALGLLFLRWAFARREARGLSHAETLALDNETLFSEEHGLTGRPDRIIREGGFIIPEEWKSSRRVYDSHRVQLGVYFILMAEHYGVSPPYGWVVLGDGTRHQVKNTEELRRRVLGITAKIREARADVRREIRVSPPAQKCRLCGQRSRCKQARA